MTDFWRDRTVLVTGHTGFKGAWLSLWLSRLGARVTGLALPPATEPNLSRLALLDSDIDGRIGDIRDYAVVRDVVERSRPSVVFHLAAQSLVRPSYEDPIGTYATNVMGTAHVLEAIRAVGCCDAAVIVTSDKCYENQEWDWPYRETEPMGGHDPYSSSKGCAEILTAAWRRSYFAAHVDGRSACRIATARAGNVIGGGDWSKDRLVPDLMRNYVLGRPTEIRSPSAIRPWQHVLEPLSGYMVLAERLAGPDGARFADAWNFGPADSDCRPVAEIAARLESIMERPGLWYAAKAAPALHEAKLLKVDSSRARAQLRWKPRLGLDESIEWTAAWYLAHARGQDCRATTLQQLADFEGHSMSDQ